jgi:hypothetical protein
VSPDVLAANPEKVTSWFSAGIGLHSKEQQSILTLQAFNQ